MVRRASQAQLTRQNLYLLVSSVLCWLNVLLHEVGCIVPTPTPLSNVSINLLDSQPVSEYLPYYSAFLHLDVKSHSSNYPNNPVYFARRIQVISAKTGEIESSTNILSPAGPSRGLIYDNYKFSHVLVGDPAQGMFVLPFYPSLDTYKTEKLHDLTVVTRILSPPINASEYRQWYGAVGDPSS